MRINKLFSNYGICSRKETNKLIQENRIKVNGKDCVLGQWVDENRDEITFDGKSIFMNDKVYIALNKPVGVICSLQKEIKNNITNFMGYPEYIFPVGRLDKESQGLIIMTNDGKLANGILESDNMHEKEYIVQVDKNFSEEFLQSMAGGVEILGEEGSGIKRISDTLGIWKNIKYEDKAQYESNTNEINTMYLKDINKENIHLKSKIKTRPCRVNKVNENTFKIILTQGLNRQIRKMCGALGYKVIRLERIRIMNIKVDNIEYGKWRYLSDEEITHLTKEIYHKENDFIK